MKPRYYCLICGEEIEHWQEKCDKCLRKEDEQRRKSLTLAESTEDMYEALTHIRDIVTNRLEVQSYVETVSALTHITEIINKALSKIEGRE